MGWARMAKLDSEEIEKGVSLLVSLSDAIVWVYNTTADTILEDMAPDAQRVHQLAVASEQQPVAVEYLEELIPLVT
eukprot:NODE_7082_length_269_cov_313.268182_g6469_i0.p2 GENE.NODE_7082_length_269_cov_313.268182_g6469_i0~~NODE_7082_length_269_cov_313.268182_g6469_i0.p2  ORF type:complete len:76 (+),score=9.43 NODE_7082_length_269_cov_313.268182_g6469_i0:31-258(+)